MRVVQMPKAWDITTGDPNVIVATVDTGVDSSVGDLQGALVPGWDFITNTATTQDSFGHGTAVSSEIVGRGNNGQGIAGYCWRCRLMPIRVSASGANIDPGLTALGIRYAAEQGARIISLSFNDEGAYPNGDPQVAAAIAYAAQRNVLVFASAGNTGSSGLTHPASAPGAYAVAGTDQSDALYSWSTLGSWIHLAAPGCQWVIWSNVMSNVCGNSTAAPAVAGIAALMLSVNPGLTPAQVVNALQSTAVPVNGIDGGRVDAYKALLAVGGRVPTKVSPPPPAPPPPPPAALKRLKKTPGPHMETHIQHGVLGAHREIRIKVLGGKVAATFRSPKAKSCTVTLSSNDALWVSTGVRAGSVSLSAKVPAGRYKVDLSCRVRRPKPFALVLRAIFA